MKLLLLFISLTVLLSGCTQKYDGLTAEEWAGDYEELSGCVEDNISYVSEDTDPEELASEIESCL